MNLFIPACGFQIRLSEDWSFDLYYERRNKSLLSEFGYTFLWNWRYPGDGISEEESLYKSDPTSSNGFRLKSEMVTIPSDSVLEVARVYVRANSKSAQSDVNDYDSVTFRIVSSPKKNLVKKTFWAKLSEVNNIVFENDDLVSSKEQLRTLAKERKSKLNPKKIKSILWEVKNFHTGFWNPSQCFSKFKGDVDKFGNELRPQQTRTNISDDYYWAKQAFVSFQSHLTPKFKKLDGCCTRLYHPEKFEQYQGYAKPEWYFQMPEWRLIVISNSEDTEILEVRLVKESELPNIIERFQAS